MAVKTKAGPNQIEIDFDAILQELFLHGDIRNIANMLPKLYVTQHEDVAAIEKRFQEGKGYLCTNGTGTGKTFVGLGTVYRFWKQGKKNILIVVPTDKKAHDWIEDGAYVGIGVYMLQGINDKGHGVRVTTYANFYQNEALNSLHWDLIVYDESHYLNQNADGKDTVYLQQHREVSNIPSTARSKAIDILGTPPTWEEYKNDRAIIDRYNERFNATVKNIVESTKVLFLSATPFAYHKNIQYADGCLFDINESMEIKEKSSGYNDLSGFDQFMSEHFGYRMRYNKLTIPETGVDINLMERNFFETWKEKGVMSTRVLELDKDYSRDFVTLDSKLGKVIDDGMSLFWKPEVQDKYPLLSKVSTKKYNYNYVNQLLECIKAREVHVRIKQHISLGRKVVVFHSYNHSTVEHPFRFDFYKLLSEEDRYLIRDLEKELFAFSLEYPQYYNLDLSGLRNSRDAILDHFPNAKQFNGTIPKKKRSAYADEFNKDNSGVDIILVQTKAGKEGISFHDKTGNKPRVLINLGLPTAPTEAIQIEGRIYREGLFSNAIYEYMTLQTDFEKIAFGTKIAQRSKTAENLAMGNLARDLESAFKDGYIASSYMEPNLEQGTGGKESDRFIYSLTEFDKSKTFYYARQKRNAKNKAREGVDYFATPEPLGYKMVEWLNPQDNDAGMEPSAGHGAIARFFPTTTRNHFVEPSHSLIAELSINAKGNIEEMRFEDYWTGNKMKFIAMNPPFGTNGKTAMDHLAKAFKHLDLYGQLLCIVPNGPTMRKRLEEFMETKEFEKFQFVGEIILPTVTFERAGTSVSCKILKFQHNWCGDFKFNRIDLSHCNKVERFFDEIEHLNF